VHYKQGTHEAASDASVVYNARLGVWLISSLPINTSGVNVATSSSKDGIHWSDPVMVNNGTADDKNWITCDNNTKSPFYGLLRGMGRGRFGPYEHLHGRWQDLGTS
jgi:hypothetical protein